MQWVDMNVSRFDLTKAYYIHILTYIYRMGIGWV